jgi:hypothetical protein
VTAALVGLPIAPLFAYVPTLGTLAHLVGDTQGQHPRTGLCAAAGAPIAALTAAGQL